MIKFTVRKRFRNRILYCAGLFCLPSLLDAQMLPIKVENDPTSRSITITAGGKPFTTFIYTDTLPKPVLYPIYAADGESVTRGFPLAPRPGEPVDHPHHIGLWFNYENVAGLDFWNNSYAIPAAKKDQYGYIHVDSILEARTTNANEAETLRHYPNIHPANPVSSGTAVPRPGGSPGQNFYDPNHPYYGIVRYAASWNNQKHETLLREHTTLIFSGNQDEWTIDRLTTLTAVADTGVSFPDAKDGMLGLRVTKELQIPSNTPGQFVDDKGNITRVAAGNTPDINGNYITSEGKTGDSAWGTRGSWCMLYGKKGRDTLSILIIDNPANPGYPTYWHARGYGLFAANPLGQKIFSNGRETMNFHLDKGRSASFLYRVVIYAGQKRLSTDRIRANTDGFARYK